MSFWRDMLRVLGLSNDARVQISAPGIDVVITGEPLQVRALLGVVKNELERSARRPQKVLRTSQIVQPTELDEMDSPYALPEADALVQPVAEGDPPTEEAEAKPAAAPPVRVAKPGVGEPGVDAPGVEGEPSTADEDLSAVSGVWSDDEQPSTVEQTSDEGSTDPKVPKTPIEERMTARRAEPKARPVRPQDVQVTGASASKIDALISSERPAIQIARNAQFVKAAASEQHTVEAVGGVARAMEHSGTDVDRTAELRPDAKAHEEQKTIDEPATLVPELHQTRDDPLVHGAIERRPVVKDVTAFEPDFGTAIDLDSDEPPDQEVTALSKNPSGPVPQPSVSKPNQAPREEVTAVSKHGPMIDPHSAPFVTDGGPTLAPSETQTRQRGMREHEMVELSESDIQEL